MSGPNDYFFLNQFIIKGFKLLNETVWFYMQLKKFSSFWPGICTSQKQMGDFFFNFFGLLTIS